MSCLISFAASALLCASVRTSVATTAKPRPCVPARAASTAALSASMFVWKAMPSMTVMMSAIFFDESLIDDIVCTTSPTSEKMVSNVHEIVARDAPVIALVTEGDRSLDGVATDVFVMPAVEEAASAVLNTVMLQLFAYHVAIELGRDVDQPRNLAKSVTVE